MKNITLRMAVTADVKATLLLAVHSIEHTCNKDYTPRQIEVWIKALSLPDRLLRSILHEHFIVATLNDEILGFGSLDNGNYLNYLYVSYTD